MSPFRQAGRPLRQRKGTGPYLEVREDLPWTNVRKDDIVVPSVRLPDAVVLHPRLPAHVLVPHRQRQLPLPAIPHQERPPSTTDAAAWGAGVGRAGDLRWALMSLVSQTSFSARPRATGPANQSWDSGDWRGATKIRGAQPRSPVPTRSTYHQSLFLHPQLSLTRTLTLKEGDRRFVEKAHLLAFGKAQLPIRPALERVEGQEEARVRC